MSARPLPPNRRLAKRKAPPAVVDAPDDRFESPDDQTPRPAPPGPTMPPPAAPASSSRWVEALRTTAGVLATVGMALACVWGLVRYTRTSPRFAIRTVDVTGASHLPPDAIAHAGGIAVGNNIFMTDLENARRRMLDDPWIERVGITRRLPSTVRIEVVEREAAAVVAVGPELYLATRDGDIFKKIESGDPYDLPVVTGVLESELAKDRAGAVATIARALELVAEYERVGPAKRLPVQEVHVDDDGSLVLVVGKDGTVLRMGKGPYRQPLEQAARVLSEVAARRAEAAVVFLDNAAHPERVVVRMR